MGMDERMKQLALAMESVRGKSTGAVKRVRARSRQEEAPAEKLEKERSTGGRNYVCKHDVPFRTARGIGGRAPNTEENLPKRIARFMFKHKRCVEQSSV